LIRPSGLPPWGFIIMLESTLVKNIIKALNKHTQKRSLWIKIHGGPFQVAGLPDIIGLYKGTFYGFEVKCPGKEDTLTPLQKHFIKKINDSGGIARMVVSVDETIKSLK